MNVKKYLDSAGLSRLATQINNFFFNKQEIQTIVETIDEEKADKASPAFSGVPTAPTADNNTNSTQIATTAFVKNLNPVSYDDNIEVVINGGCIDETEE